MRSKLFIALCGVLTFNTAASAADLIVAGGILEGAHNVEVDGTLYDVAFKDGTVKEVFGSPPVFAATNFIFHNTLPLGGATTAGFLFANALQSQVLLDGVAGLFNTHPELTFGCSDVNFCQINTPVAYTADQANLSWVALGNMRDPSSPCENCYEGTSYQGGSFLDEYDTASMPDTVWADWTLASRAPAVPVPAAAWLFGSGLLGLAGTARKRKAV